jgi:malate permease and related proteins
MPVNIIINQILILVILVMTGIIGSGLRVITPPAKDFLAKIIFNITLPAMLFTNFSMVDLTPRLLNNSLMVLLLATLSLLFMLFVGWLTSRILRLKHGDAGIFRLHSMMGNIIYLGFPVISALFGKEGLLYASIFTLVSNFLMWTVGLLVITRGKEVSVRRNLKHFFNPNTIAIVSGFILFLLSVKLPPIILDSLGGLGSTNTYLSMLFIGSILFYASVRDMISNIAIYVLSFNRLILVPFLLVSIFMFANTIFPGKIDPLVISVIVMQSAMPCMVNVVIMVNILGENDSIATANVFVSTLLSILTLPLILMSLRLLG